MLGNGGSSGNLRTPIEIVADDTVRWNARAGSRRRNAVAVNAVSNIIATTRVIIKRTWYGTRFGAECENVNDERRPPPNDD